MNKKIIKNISLMTACLACRYYLPCTSEVSFMLIEAIPLTLRYTGPGTFVPEVEIKVDGHSKIFLLDTGAVSSSIANDVHVDSYPSMGERDSKAAAGIGKKGDIIEPDKISVGSYSFRRSQITRCSPSLLGLDRLKEIVFQIDLKSKTLNLLKHFPIKSTKHQLHRLSPGHMTVPLRLGKMSVDALFDTGADTTVIDSQFIKSNKNLFELLRSEVGTDALGNKIPSEVYLCRSVQVGDLIVNDIEMAAFNFGDHLRKHMEGCPIILGNNVISHARWTFDLTLNEWNCEVTSSN
ncbi:aspartyl protease family protein [Bdellovibrio bacteriovorus]|uniref:aspartyl protease family protein n=1 Tax=Bdellovibrio TaxID=958 RepID=UPI0035A8FCC1